MNKYLLRLVALWLVPCLLADPGFCRTFAHLGEEGASPASDSSAAFFAQQAFAQRQEAFANWLTRTPTVEVDQMVERALVLDDRTEERFPPKVYLAAQGYRVDDARGLFEAIKMVRRAKREGQPYTRVISDFDLGRKFWQKYAFRNGLWFVLWLAMFHEDIAPTLHSTAFNRGRKRFLLTHLLTKWLGIPVQAKDVIANAILPLVPLQSVDDLKKVLGGLYGVPVLETHVIGREGSKHLVRFEIGKRRLVRIYLEKNVALRPLLGAALEEAKEHRLEKPLQDFMARIESQNDAAAAASTVGAAGLNDHRFFADDMPDLPAAEPDSLGYHLLLMLQLYHENRDLKSFTVKEFMDWAGRHGAQNNYVAISSVLRGLAAFGIVDAQRSKTYSFELPVDRREKLLHDRGALAILVRSYPFSNTQYPGSQKIREAGRALWRALLAGQLKPPPKPSSQIQSLAQWRSESVRLIDELLFLNQSHGGNDPYRRTAVVLAGDDLMLPLYTLQDARIYMTLFRNVVVTGILIDNNRSKMIRLKLGHVSSGEALDVPKELPSAVERTLTFAKENASSLFPEVAAEETLARRQKDASLLAMLPPRFSGQEAIPFYLVAPWRVGLLGFLNTVHDVAFLLLRNGYAIEHRNKKWYLIPPATEAMRAAA